jgi:uncharacterized protein (TIGR03000 family)
MVRFALSFLFAASTVCALPGVSSAQNWYGEGPAARHDSGYVYPGTSSSAGPSAFYGRTWSPTYSPTYQSYNLPIYSSNSMPVVVNANSTPSMVTEEEQEEPASAMRTASIQVRVPANAEIWFDNSKTRQTGALRIFVSPPLDSGKMFTYVVHARWTDNSGKVIDQTKKVEVQAGTWSIADFTSEVMKNRP